MYYNLEDNDELGERKLEDEIFVVLQVYGHRGKEEHNVLGVYFSLVV